MSNFVVTICTDIVRPMPDAGALVLHVCHLPSSEYSLNPIGNFNCTSTGPCASLCRHVSAGVVLHSSAGHAT